MRTGQPFVQVQWIDHVTPFGAPRERVGIWRADEAEAAEADQEGQQEGEVLVALLELHFHDFLLWNPFLFIALFPRRAEGHLRSSCIDVQYQA